VFCIVLLKGHLQPPLVVHVVYRFAVGGLENGLVNLINSMPRERYRHAIVCLTDYTEFRDRIQRVDIPFFALHKHEGQDFGVYFRFWRVLQKLHPTIVHTRNLAGLEFLIPAALGRVQGRIHGEHGRDVYDLDGTSAKYNLWRRAIKPFVHHYTTVSTDLAGWLMDTVGADPSRVTQIYSGVDTRRFCPRKGPRPAIGPKDFAPHGTLVIGTVGRMEAVKDQLTLVRAFLHLLCIEKKAHERLRLVMIGDGPLREEARQLLQASNAERFAWLPGERADIPQILRSFDLFVLPSRGEGISNTILEAMATGLPVVATRVGGSPELVEEGQTGRLVPPADPVALAASLYSYLADNDLLTRHGRAGRRKVEACFSMETMVNGYLAVYDSVLNNPN